MSDPCVCRKGTQRHGKLVQQRHRPSQSGMAPSTWRQVPSVGNTWRQPSRPSCVRSGATSPCRRQHEEVGFDVRYCSGVARTLPHSHLLLIRDSIRFDSEMKSRCYSNLTRYSGVSAHACHTRWLSGLQHPSYVDDSIKQTNKR